MTAADYRAETTAEWAARKIAENVEAHKRHKEKMSKDPDKYTVSGIDTTGEPVGEVWKEGDELFLTHAGTLTNVEPVEKEENDN